MCLSRHWDGFPLGLGLVVEDKPTELSCMYVCTHMHHRLIFQFVHGSGGTCNHQLRAPDTFRNSNSNNWVFTQAVDYLDAVELIVNATVRFSGCTQRPECTNDFVILHRYDTNSLSENQRNNTANYQPYLGAVSYTHLTLPTIYSV